MSGIIFYIFDCETNGLNQNFHEVTEMCCIRESDRISMHRNIRMEYPERSSQEALNVTGKTVDEIQCGATGLEAIEDFELFINRDGLTPQHRCLVAHNANFDRRFLHALWAKHNRRFPADLWCCTQSMARTALKTRGIAKPKVNLDAVGEAFGIKKVAGKHNAVSDSRNLYFIWQKLKDEGVHPLDFIKTIPHILADPASLPVEAENDE